MKTHKHIGCYGILIEKNRILLIDKVGGPYDGKLDLPGGGFKDFERPLDTLKREFKEETNLDIQEYQLLDVDSVTPIWHNDGDYKVHHIAIFYKITKYTSDLKEKIEVNNINDDSKGARFYDINTLSKDNLSDISILILEKLGYKISN